MKWANIFRLIVGEKHQQWRNNQVANGMILLHSLKLKIEE